MNNEIPVVTLHQYNAKPQKSDYTAHVINQACYKDNLIYSITDYAPAVKSNLKNYTSLDMSDLITDEYVTFIKEYEHLSTNHFNFERAAIAKFFLIKEFMQKFNYNRIFHIDSDVLIYKAVKDFENLYKVYDFTLTDNQQCGNSFFNIEVIVALCKKILKIYCDKEKCDWFKDFKKIFKKMQLAGKKGGICDMTILKYFKEKKDCDTNYNCGEMSNIIENCRFDNHIRYKDDNYKMIDERREIVFIDDIPCSFNYSLNKHVKFLSLHFGGHAKNYLHEYITYTV